MKAVIITFFIFLWIIPSNLYSHCSSRASGYKPPSRGKLPCGCNYYRKSKFIGWDCERKPIYIYEKISSHKGCKRKQYRHNRNYYSNSRYYKYKK